MRYVELGLWAIIEHVRDVVNVDATAGDVGGDEHVDTPLLEILNALVRAVCDLLPWMASASMSSFPSCPASLLAPCLVRVKTMARRMPSCGRVG